MHKSKHKTDEMNKSKTKKKEAKKKIVINALKVHIEHNQHFFFLYFIFAYAAHTLAKKQFFFRSKAIAHENRLHTCVVRSNMLALQII